MDLATAAARDVARFPHIDVAMTATLLATSALRHGTDLTALPVTNPTLRSLLDGYPDAQSRYRALRHRVATAPLDSTQLRSALRTTNDPEFAQAAVSVRNASAQERHQAVIDNPNLPDTVRLESCAALAADAMQASFHLVTFTAAVEHIRRFAASTTSAQTLCSLAGTLLGGRAARGRAGTLGEAVLVAAATNPHLRREDSRAMFDEVRHVAHAPILAALAAQPATLPVVRAECLIRVPRRSRTFVWDIGQALQAGASTPVGNVAVRDLDSDTLLAVAARAATRQSTYTHPAWQPASVEMTQALLTIEGNRDLTLTELISTARAVTT